MEKIMRDIENLRKRKDKIDDSNPFRFNMLLDQLSLEKFVRDIYSEEVVMDGELVLYPKYLESGKISAKPLSDVLEYFQSVVNSVINNLSGNLNQTGRYSRDVLLDSEVTVNVINPGSFRVGISFENKQQMNLFDKESNKRRMDIVSKAFNYLKYDSLIDVINEYDFRTYNNFKKLFNAFQKHELAFNITNFAQDSSIEFSPAEIRAINDNFKKELKTEKDNALVLGRLSQIDIDRKRFTLKDINDKEKEYSFQVADESFKDSDMQVNQFYKANAEKTTYSISNYETAIKYVILNVKDIKHVKDQELGIV